MPVNHVLGYFLEPGETLSTECKVSELYDMTRPGEYFFRVLQVDAWMVESNTVSVRVVP